MKKQIHTAIVTGEYNAWGYSMAVTVNREVVKSYSAGNNSQDSIAIAIPGSPNALPLREIRSMCMREVRREVSVLRVSGWLVKNGGVERIDP